MLDRNDFPYEFPGSVERARVCGKLFSMTSLQTGIWRNSVCNNLHTAILWSNMSFIEEFGNKCYFSGKILALSAIIQALIQYDIFFFLKILAYAVSDLWHLGSNLEPKVKIHSSRNFVLSILFESLDSFPIFHQYTLFRVKSHLTINVFVKPMELITSKRVNTDHHSVACPFGE